MRTTGKSAILEERRRIAAKMFEKNMDSEQIAELLGVHCQTEHLFLEHYPTAQEFATVPADGGM